MKDKIFNFVQNNSPDGGFLQSEYWRKFQESWGRKIYNITTRDNDELIAYANIITHTLPVAGDYFYVPRGPVVKIFNFQFSIFKQLEKFLNELINLAKKENINWIRIEPASKEILKTIKESLPKSIKIKKSSVDMQPREILIMDISGSEEKLLVSMKQKTRYNIRLAEKKGVKILVSRDEKYIDEFCNLVRITSERDKIKSHPESYYRKMLEVIPPEILKLYVAEYEGKIIAANLFLLFGRTATYMHGASDNAHRDVMAPYLLQWQSILDAKRDGCTKYDFGGIKTINSGDQSWEGITKFKTGFTPETKTVQFPGCYDIIVKPARYNLYRALQQIKRIF